MSSRMSNPIIIHDVGHASAAMAVAVELDIDITLVSAPGAVAYLGATVFRDIIAEAARENPQARYTAVLDCGDEPGLALGAMRHGIKAVRISNGPEISDKLADIATQRGVTVYQGEDPEIDLGGMTDPAGACRAWLRGDVS